MARVQKSVISACNLLGAPQAAAAVGDASNRAPFACHLLSCGTRSSQGPIVKRQDVQGVVVAWVNIAGKRACHIFVSMESQASLSS